MNEEQIKQLIKIETARQLKREKEQLTYLLENKFLYKGEFVQTRKFLDAIKEWSRS